MAILTALERVVDVFMTWYAWVFDTLYLLGLYMTLINYVILV